MEQEKQVLLRTTEWEGKGSELRERICPNQTSSFQRKGGPKKGLGEAQDWSQSTARDRGLVGRLGWAGDR